MSIENIIARILADQEAADREVLTEAGRRKEEIEERAKAEAEAIAYDLEQKAVADAALLIERRKAVAELEGRKLILAARQKAIARSFEEALREMENMDEDAYIEFLVKKIRAAGDGGEILLNERDRKAIGKKLIVLINGSASAGSFQLADQAIRAKGGFLLRRGKIETNGTLEALVEEAKDRITPKVVQVLF